MTQRENARSWAKGLPALIAAALVAAAVGGAAVAPAGAANRDTCSTSTPYTLAVGALTGTAATDVSLSVATAPGCPAVDTVKHVQLQWLSEAACARADAEGPRRARRTWNLNEVAAPGGVAALTLPRVERGRRIDVQVLVQGATPSQTFVLRATTTSQLRPDLAVTHVRVPAQTLTTRPVTVSADVAELGGDTGAEADVTLASAVGPVGDPIHVTVPAGQSVSVAFPQLALTEAVPTQLKVVVAGAAPEEASTDNDESDAVVDVTKNELALNEVGAWDLLVQSLGGYGYQFNHHLYAPITTASPDPLPGLESKVKALEPQLVRIFFNDNWELNADKTHPESADNLDSFRRVVALANGSGATIVIAYQGLTNAKANPTLWMSAFADELQELVVNRGLTGVRWVTIGNEPNSSAVTLAQYEALYRALDKELRDRGLRDRIGLIGGDLVQNNEGTAGGHRAWFTYMVAHMNDVLDAWSEHIYWNYFDTGRMEERLKDVAYLVHEELPEAARKPTLLMEYGVRGYNTCGTKTQITAAYYRDESCTELRRMSLAGFQKLWFSIEAAQLGFDGASNWDLYWSVYDRTKNNQSYWEIGPPEEGWPLYPSYHALRLLLQTTTRGWQVLRVAPWTADDAAARYDRIVRDTPEQELTAFSGGDGQMTILGLDTNGGQLTAPNGASSSYSIGNLPPSTTFELAVWNANGDGLTTDAGTVATTPAGVARFDVPLQAAFALTTVPVS
jgi:hypothetical protein